MSDSLRKAEPLHNARVPGETDAARGWRGFFPIRIARLSAVDYTVLACLALLFFTVIAGVWGVRFTTVDDATIPFTPSEFALAQTTAKDQGRIYYFYHVPLVVFANRYLWQGVGFELVQYGSFTLSAAMLAAMLMVYVGPRFALINAFIYISSIAVIWDHALITSVPVVHYVFVTTLCAALLCLYRYRLAQGTAWLVASITLFVLSILGQEYQIVIATSLMLVCMFTPLRGRSVPTLPGLPPRHKAVFIVGGIAAGYVLLVLMWRLQLGNTYDGAELALGKFRLTAFLGILAIWSISAQIFYYWWAPVTVAGPPGVRYQVTFDAASIAANLDALAVLKVIAVVIGLFVLFQGPRDPVLSARKKLIIPILCLIVMWAPSALLGITVKYQAWYSAGVSAYTYSSISAYGFTILLTWAFVCARDLLVRQYWRHIVQSALIVFLAFAALTSAYQSNRVGLAMKEASGRWFAIDLLMRSPFKNDVENSTLIAPRLASHYWSVPMTQANWEPFFYFVYNAKPRVSMRHDGSDIQNGSGSKFYFDFVRLPSTGQHAAVLSPVEQKNSKWVTTDFRVMSWTPLLASLYVIDATGGLHRYWLPDHQRSGDERLYVYRVRTPEVESSVARIDDQNYWSPPLRQ